MGIFEMWANDAKIMFVVAIVSLFFGLIGVIGVGITIWSILSQQKKESAYEEILNAAKRENQFKMTEAQIQQQEVYAQELKTQIMTEIPKYAKISVLEAKANRIESELVEEYQEYLHIKEELKKLECDVSETELDNALSNLLHEKKFTLDRKRGIWIIVAAFCVVPIIEEYIFVFLHRLIFMTEAHISPELLAIYLCSLIAATAIVFVKYKRETSNSQSLFLLIKAIVAIVAWFFSFYIPLYDIVKILLIQLLLTVSSIIFFAFGVNYIFHLLYILIYIKRIGDEDLTKKS